MKVNIGCLWKGGKRERGCIEKKWCKFITSAGSLGSQNELSTSLDGRIAGSEFRMSRKTGLAIGPTLNAALEPPSTWAEFYTFPKEHISPARLRIANIGKKLHSLRQRPGQTVPQLIAHLEALEWQWPEPLQDSVRASYLTQALHDYKR